MDSEYPEIYTTEENKEIKPIGQDTVHRICSGQVILNLSIAMKELVENAIDAGAKIIDIHLKDYGMELLEVVDNGCGVHKDNFQLLTLKHYTSKLRQFHDLENIKTLGFRGEALSSLCALCNVEVTTKHHTADVATKMRYNNSGKIISEEITARQQGTTVALSDLFATLPVRKKEFMKNIKKEFVKLCNLLYAYCLLPSGIKYTCTNTTNKGSKTTIVKTEGHSSVKENIISIFGVKQLSSLIDIELVSPEEKILEEYRIDLNPGDELPFNFEFLISSVLHGSGRSSADRQFYYVNHRPCEPTKLMKLINEVYKQFNFRQYPFVYLNVITKSALVDVNITPDKRQVFLEKEKLLLAVIKSSLLEAFKIFPSTFKLQNLELMPSQSKTGLKRNFSDENSNASSLLQRFIKKSKSDESHVVLYSEKDITDSQIEAENKLKHLVDIACKLSKEDHLTENIVDAPTFDDTNADVTIDSPMKNCISRKELKLKVNIDSLRQRLKKVDINDELNEKNKVKFRSIIGPETAKAAEEELAKHISKSEFEKMEIIGQFNLGFIITKLNNDLFIVDQHASDEKYNFEQLQLNMAIDSQKLVSPKLLELTTAAKNILIDNEDVFKKNGFIFNHKQSVNGAEELYLTTVPISDKVVFGKSDIDEMIFMLQEDSSQTATCRPSKIRSMFASRACRKSVMIGKPLSKANMRKLVIHMGEIEQPWNCPHGRPTMRHLVNLNLLI